LVRETDPQITQIEGNTVTFWLNVKPRSAKERLDLDASGELRLCIHAAPTEGQANAACVEFLARVLRVSRSSVEIVTGEKSRRKLVRIRSATPRVVAERLTAHVGATQTSDAEHIGRPS
jgi:uncharacterized protein (TIGR00251 family)